MPSRANGQHDLLHREHPRVIGTVLALWAMAGSLFIVMAIPAVRDGIQGLDDAVWRVMVDIEQGWVTGAAKALDVVGRGAFTFLVIVVIAVVLAVQRRWPSLWVWLVAMTLSQAFIGPLKDLYERPRPTGALVETSSWSFPSGHSAAGAAIAVGLVFVFTRPGPVRRNLAVVAAVFAFLMAISRVYLRAHWLTDVTAGAALGSAAVITAVVLVHRVGEGRAAPDRS